MTAHNSARRRAPFLGTTLQILCSVLLFSIWSLPGRATTVTPPAFAELVNGADYIVRARVADVTSERMDRPGGPALIRTRVTLEVIETLAGAPPEKPVLFVLGGKVGDLEMRVDGVPLFEVGKEEVMFVAGNGRTFYPLYAAMHGRYPIQRDAAGREVMLRSNGVALADVAEISLPMVEGPLARLQARRRSSTDALSVAEFRSLIAAQRKGSGK
jgi:hypothetical protein